MSDTLANSGPADSLELVRSAPDFRSRALLAALSAASLMFPVATGFFGKLIASSTSIRSAGCALLAVAVAAVVAPAVPAFRNEIRQFDIAAGLISIVVAFKLLQILATAARAEMITSLSIGFVTLAVAGGIGIVQGASSIRRPQGVVTR